MDFTDHKFFGMDEDTLSKKIAEGTSASASFLAAKLTNPNASMSEEQKQSIEDGNDANQILWARRDEAFVFANLPK